MDDHEGKSFTRTPLQILKLPRLNEHDFVAGLGAALECAPLLSSCAKVETTCDGDRSGGSRQEPASEAPRGSARLKRILRRGWRGSDSALRTPLEFLSDRKGSIHDFALSKVGNGSVEKSA